MEAHASALGGIANSHQRCSDSAIPQPKLSFVSLIAATSPHTLSQLLFQLRCRGERGSDSSRAQRQHDFSFASWGKRKLRLAFSSAAAMEAHASALGGIANSHQRCSNSAIPQPKLSFVSLIAAAPPHTLSQLLFQLRCRGGKEEAAPREAQHRHDFSHAL